MHELDKEFRKRFGELEAERQSGAITPEEGQKREDELRSEGRARAKELMWSSRDGMVPGFGDVAFSLEVGECGVAPHDPVASPYGWHVIKRLE